MSGPDDHDLPTLEDYLRRQKWQSQALCRWHRTEQFFRSPTADISAVKVACGACPVRQECLAYALGDETLQVVWGGSTERERERRAMRRRGSAVA
jgi:WhiB family transcriptional regulator, redox-sensing transcriptional regulator